MIPVIRSNRVRNLWNDPFEAMHKDLDHLMSNFVNGDTENRGAVGSYPVDIHEDEDHVYFEAEMPGFTKDDVEVTLEAGVLSLTGERKEEECKGSAHLRERRFRRVHRSFSLPTGVDENKVDAQLRDGVLHITLNKKEEVKPRKIQIK